MSFFRQETVALNNGSTFSQHVNFFSSYGRNDGVTSIRPAAQIAGIRTSTTLNTRPDYPNIITKPLLSLDNHKLLK